MDPQSVSFQPQNDLWRFQSDLQRLSAIQAEHSDRLLRVERKLDDDARMKSVWGGASPFPGVLSSTPQQTPLQNPPSDAFKNFDDESANLIGSLHLDAEEEPRRTGATSRANSVRFDESANQGWAHASRSSMDLMRSTGGLALGERSLSHKSDGRASSVHSLRSAASGRANSLNLDTGFSFGDSNRSPVDAPGLAPGLFLLGSVPAIIRCWMSNKFRHDALMYAAVCTGSHRSFLDRRIVDKLGYGGRVNSTISGLQTIVLPVYLPEAVPHPASSRAGSPAPQLPTLTVTFTILTPLGSPDDKGIQIVLGSDTLRVHNADILFSSNNLSLFDDDRSKISVPLVRPEDERTFNTLQTMSSETYAPAEGDDVEPPKATINGLGQSMPSSAESIPSLASGVPIGTPRRTSAAAVTAMGVSDQANENDAAPPSKSLRFAQLPDSSPVAPPSETTTTESREPKESENAKSNSSRTVPTPAIWSNWRQRPAETGAPSTMDYANAGKARESTPRKESGIKVLRPMKATTRTFSSTSISSPTFSDNRSRFFDDGKRRATLDSWSADKVASQPSSDGMDREGQSQAESAGGVGQDQRRCLDPLRDCCFGFRKSFACSHLENRISHIILSNAASEIRPALILSLISRVPASTVEDVSLIPLPFNTRPGAALAGGSLAGTTASSSKKRKTVLSEADRDAATVTDGLSGVARFAPELSHPDRQPSPSLGSSSPLPSNITSRGTTPSSTLGRTSFCAAGDTASSSARFLEGIDQAGDSPTDAYASLTISGETGFEEAMTGEGQDKDATGSRDKFQDVGVARRSASPAKRSAAAMEGREENSDHGVGGITSPRDTTMQDGEREGTLTQNLDLRREDVDDDIDLLDERVKKVYALLQEEIEADEEGYVVSNSWLGRVMSRSREGKSIQQWDKDLANGPIGPIDNSGIVTHGGFEGPHLKFERTDIDYIPLKPQMERGTDYEVLTRSAWDAIVEWYGIADNQPAIIRYAKNTAPPGSTQKYIQYEIYPPVVTVRKMLATNSRRSQPPSPPRTDENGQANPEHTTPERDMFAVRLLASRQDGFQAFLARCKKAAGIPLHHKVKPWRQIKAPQDNLNPSPTARPGILTPAASRSTSPNTAASTQWLPTLVVQRSEFDTLQEGTVIEAIETQDHTNDENYNGKSTLDLLGLIEGQTLILEEQIRGPAGGEFVSDAKRNKQQKDERMSSSQISDTAITTTGLMTRGRTRGSGRPRGNIGLQNLGNTCYMNSALQCISRIEELAWYFLTQHYKTEINIDNPLGHHGSMAKAYGEFLGGLYREGQTSFSPKSFKHALSNAQPMFSGYGQQDSQEFLSFLVDALHEDLNRIQRKPYMENPDSDDSRVHDPEYIRELGNIYRDNHRKRNDSIAMDLFNGFYRNTMVCPACEKISVTFDPFSLITLQLPIESKWQHKIIFIPRQGRPSAHEIEMDKSASIKSLKQRFAEKVKARAECLFVAEFFSCKLYKVWKDPDGVSEISNSDVIVVFELEHGATNVINQKSLAARSTYGSRDIDDMPDMESPMADHMAVTVINRVPNRSGALSASYQPMIVMISRDEAKDFDLILKKILAQVAKYTSREIFSSDGPLVARGVSSRGDSSDDLTSSSESAEPVDAKLSDTSLHSDGEYVNVSMRDGSASADVQSELPDVLQPGTAIPTPLRGLFEVGYFQFGNGDLNCANSTLNMDTAPMQERVKTEASRRSSVVSLDSAGTVQSEQSGASSESQASSRQIENDEASPFASSTFAGDPISDEDLPYPSPHLSFKNANKDRFQSKNRKRRGRGRPPKTYSRKAHRATQKSYKKAEASHRINGNRSIASSNSSDDPYYIKLGEGIVLDWTEDGWDALFGNVRHDPEDERGYQTLDNEVIEVIKDPELEAKLERRARRKKEGVSLDDCFAETAKTETLSEENAWYCNRCKELRRADKTLMIWTAPDVLVLHLKRFSGERYRRDKVDVLVDFPTEGLDISDRVGMKEDGKEYVYDLFAVDNHYGGLGGGHYTAYAKNFFDGKWYDFNDSMVSGSSPVSAVTPAAYLLFYRRRSPEPLGPPYLRDLVQKARVDATNAPNPETESVSFSGQGRTLGGATNGDKPPARLLLPASRQTPVTAPEEDEGIGMGPAYDFTPTADSPIGTCDGRIMQGPVRPPGMESPSALRTRSFGDQGGSWGFGGLDAGNDDDDDDDDDDVDHHLHHPSSGGFVRGDDLEKED